MSVRTKVGLGFNNYIRENELGWDDSAFSVFTTNSEDVEGKPLFNRFAKTDSMKGVPPPLSGDYTSLSDHIDLDDLEPSSKRQKSTEAPIPSVPEVPPSPVVSSPKSFSTRRKSLGRNHLTKPKSKLKELDFDADDQTFIKVVSNEDSEDEAPLLWSALVGWEVITTPL
nr:hypothetical protein [Tanacetum cinerariifolium]